MRQAKRAESAGKRERQTERYGHAGRPLANGAV